MRTNKDIIVFPKIDNSYVIKTGQAMMLDGGSKLGAYAIEWNVFAWKGHRVGCFYEKIDGSGYLFLPVSDENDSEGLRLYGVHFDIGEKHYMHNMKSAVTYSWLKGVQKLKNISNDKKPRENGCICNKYGIRVFVGGPHENTLFSLFDSRNRMMGCIDETKMMGLTAFMSVQTMFLTLVLDVLTYRKDKTETPEEMLERVMVILKRK